MTCARAERYWVVLNCPNEGRTWCNITFDTSLSSQLPPDGQPPSVTSLNRTAVRVGLFFSHGTVVVLEVRAEDGLGNAARAAYTWRMETALPETRVSPPVPPFLSERSQVRGLHWCAHARGGESSQSWSAQLRTPPPRTR